MNVKIKLPTGLTMDVKPLRYIKETTGTNIFLFYTKNEKIENGLTKMYVSRVGAEPIDDVTWNNLKGFMKNAINNTPDQNYTDNEFNKDVLDVSDARIIGLNDAQITGLEHIVKGAAPVELDATPIAPAPEVAPVIDPVPPTPEVTPVMPNTPVAPVVTPNVEAPIPGGPTVGDAIVNEFKNDEQVLENPLEQPVAPAPVQEGPAEAAPTPQVDITEKITRLEQLTNEMTIILNELKNTQTNTQANTQINNPNEISPFANPIPNITESDLNEQPASSGDISFDNTVVNLFDE